MLFQDAHHSCSGARRLQLIHRTLTGCLVGAPSYEPRSMSEPSTRNLIVLHLDDELTAYGHPVCAALGSPTARTTRR